MVPLATLRSGDAVDSTVAAVQRSHLGLWTYFSCFIRSSLAVCKPFPVAP